MGPPLELLLVSRTLRQLFACRRSYQRPRGLFEFDAQQSSFGHVITTAEVLRESGILSPPFPLVYVGTTDAQPAEAVQAPLMGVF